MEATIPRLNHKGTTYEEAYQYCATRAIQLLPSYTWNHELREIEGGYVTYFLELATAEFYMTVYILHQHRNQGFFKKAVKAGKIDKPIITAHDCEIENFLRRNKVEFKVVSGIWESAGYKMVEKEYGSQVARRSGVYYMNHIDEALYIMKKMGATYEAMEAYCLHPLVQGDKDLEKNLFNITYSTVLYQEKPCSYAIALAMEFRNIANQYLSQRADKFFSIDMHLSPIPEVNTMLAADKIQNYKDFLLYHSVTHIRAKYLDKYFNEWLEALKIKNFDEWFDDLSFHFPKKEQVCNSITEK